MWFKLITIKGISYLIFLTIGFLLGRMSYSYKSLEKSNSVEDTSSSKSVEELSKKDSTDSKESNVFVNKYYDKAGILRKETSFKYDVSLSSISTNRNTYKDYSDNSKKLIKKSVSIDPCKKLYVGALVPISGLYSVLHLHDASVFVEYKLLEELTFISQMNIGDYRTNVGIAIALF